MRIGNLEITKPTGSMGCIAGWVHPGGYWRWALYWNPRIKGLGWLNVKPVAGPRYRCFGGELLTPFGTLRIATQPPWPPRT